MTELYHVKQLLLFPEKQCSSCKSEKPLSEFGKVAARKDGHDIYCKECIKRRRAENRITPTSKICVVCNKEKEIALFPSNPTLKDGYRNCCKECYNIQDRNNRNQPHNREARYKRYQKIKAKRHANYKKWINDHPHRNSEHARSYYLKKKGVTVERVSYERILERDGYWCHICEQEIKPEHLSFDHVIPLNPRNGHKPGMHAESNIKPAHKICNSRKHNFLLEEMTPFQRRGMA